MGRGGEAGAGRGEAHGEGSRGGDDARGACARGAGDRVGHHRGHSVLPGHRYGGRGGVLVGGVQFGVRFGVGGEGSACSPLLAVLVACGLLATCPPALAQAPSAEREGVKTGGVYRRPLGNDPETLDPARISDIYSRSVSQQIFDGLAQFDQTLTIVPALADLWRASRDGLTSTFNLRKGVKFHHGREVTADDVVFSLERLLDPKTRSGAADLFMNLRGAREFREGRARTVVGLVALDRHTVQMQLNEAFGPFVAVLAVAHAKIVPRDLVEQHDDALGRQPVGTGPFKFSGWERCKKIVLSANRQYFGGPPRLDRLEYRIFPGEQSEAMYDEFRRGALEDTPLPTRAYRLILADSSHIYVKRPMLSVRF